MAAIIENGKSDYQIAFGARREAPEHYAARNLQDALFAMTGVRLPVRSLEQRVPDRPAIIVGAGRERADGELWHRDSYEIVPEGTDLVLSGSGARGTHYAVYAFLESIGARYYGPEDVRLPGLSVVALPEKEVRSQAAFGYRHVFYPTAQEPEWALRWKLNVHNGADERWGPNARAHSWGHSFGRLVPVSEHFKDHPEYFSLVDGIRRDRGQQLCCTNPDVAEVASERMARWIAENPRRRIFAVGMNDWHGWCECPHCAAVDRREGGPTGQLLTLVNRVAERFPDRIIATLAYSWAIESPHRMRARENVLIVLCHNEGCFTHALSDCEPNRRFLERLAGWHAKADHILIWDYYVNYHSYLMPTPNFRRIEADIRTYRDVGVEGMFCQGSAVAGGQFAGLRQYLLARLLWDPDQEAWPIVEEWARGVYGDGPAAHILEYLAMLHDHVDGNEVHMLRFSQKVQPEIFTPDILARGKRLWDKAEAAAAGEAGRKVFAARAPEMCSRLFHTGMHYEVADDRLRPQPAPDVALRGRFVEAAMLGGAAHLRENAGTPEDFARNFGRTYEAIVLESRQLAVAIVPELGGRIYSVLWKPEDLELMHISDPALFVNFLPYHAGYEFSIDPVPLGRGTEGAFQTLDREGRGRVRLRAELGGDLILESEFALTDCVLSATHTVHNGGREAAEVSPYAHPEWRYEAFGADAEVALRNVDGSWRTVQLNPEGRHSRDVPYAGADMPAGCWRLASGRHAVAIEQTFEPEAVDRCSLTLSVRNDSVTPVLRFRRRTVPPGSEQTFTTSWRFLSPADR